MRKWLKTTDTLRFEVQDATASITFNRPERRNAQSTRSMLELQAAMREADDLREIRVIVLQGEGRDFCAQADQGTRDPAAMNEEHRCRTTPRWE